MQQHDNAQPLSTNQRIWQSLQLPLVQYLLLYLVVMCVYVPTFWYTFVWDDWDFIALNKSLREWGNIPSYFTDPNTFSQDPLDQTRNEWRPLRNIYYLITYKIHGLHPAGWHFHHVLLHSLLSAMLLAFFHRLYRYAMVLPQNALLPRTVQVATWFAILAWAVHPVNTEVTAWLKSADDILACILTTICLLTLFPKHHCLTYTRAVLAGAIFAITFLAKESIAPIPAIYFCIVMILAPDRRTALKSRPFWLATVLLFCGLILYIILRKLMLGQLQQIGYIAGNFSLMMATMTSAAVRYLQLTFWPFWPTVQIGDYIGWPMARSWTEWPVVRSVMIIFVFALLLVYGSKRSRVFFAGWIFAILAFAPVSNVVPMMQVLAERFMYFPLIGVALAVAAGYKWLLERSMKHVWIPTLVAVSLTTATHVRLPVWISEQNFQSAAAKALPGNWRPMFNLAVTHFIEGETTKSINLALETMKVKPSADIASLIATSLLKQNNKTSATAYLLKAQKAFPNEPKPFMILGAIYQSENKTTAALEQYLRAAELGSDNPRYWYFAAQMQRSAGNTTAAIKLAERAVEVDSDFTSASHLLNQLTLRETE